MKIAVTHDNGTVFQHFGHTEEFKVYEVQDGAVTSSRIVGTQGQGHGALAAFLNALGVDTLICGGIGAGARQALAGAGVRLYGGVKGNADDAVRALLDGNLSWNPDAACDHHGQGHEHHHGDCGSHHFPDREGAPADAYRTCSAKLWTYPGFCGTIGTDPHAG